jgi:DNA-binding NarL/FixJ family response regulator
VSAKTRKVVSHLHKKNANMKQTSLLEKLAIAKGIKWGKSYAQIAQELQLTERVVRKWGQKAKKK